MYNWRYTYRIFDQGQPSHISAHRASGKIKKHWNKTDWALCTSPIAQLHVSKRIYINEWWKKKTTIFKEYIYIHVKICVRNVSDRQLKNYNDIRDAGS